jgi:ATP-dependent DNA ligase
VYFHVFDVLVLAGCDVMGEPLSKRRELLAKRVLPAVSVPIRFSQPLEGSLRDLVE